MTAGGGAVRRRGQEAELNPCLPARYSGKVKETLILLGPVLTLCHLADDGN